MSESLYDRNEALLSSQELGGLVLDAYNAALEVDPRLAYAAIVPFPEHDSDRNSLAVAMPDMSGHRSQRAHQVSVRLCSSDTVKSFVDSARKLDPTTWQIVSKRMGVEPNDATPEFLYGFGVLHELGHVSQYLDHERDLKAFVRSVSIARQSLPFACAPPSALATPGSKARRRLESNWADISERTGIDSIDEFIRKQAICYRDMASEADADHFAAEVFADNPELVEMLLAR